MMVFGCEETRRYVDAFIDGELDPSASVLVEAHLTQCRDCRAEAEMIRSLKRAMGSLREADRAPAQLRSRITSMLDAEDGEQRSDSPSVRKRKHATGFVLAGAALAGFVLATGRHTSMPAGVQSEAGFIPSVLEDIAAGHARSLPVEVSGAQPEQVANFFRGRLNIPVRPVSFHGIPAQLVGARFSNVGDHMAAALFYDVSGRRVTVFVFDSVLMPRVSYGVQRHVLHDNRQILVGNAHGYTVAFSEQGGVGYAVASDLPTQDALRIVEHADIQ